MEITAAVQHTSWCLAKPNERLAKVARKRPVVSGLLLLEFICMDRRLGLNVLFQFWSLLRK